MEMRRVIWMVILIGGFGASVYAAKPEKTQGIEDKPLELHALAAQIPAMAGYELRTRRVTIAAGGTIAEHSHADRPGVVYVLAGSIREHQGDVVRVLNPGDTFSEKLETVHWLENVTDKPCVLLAVDLVARK